ncbi:MAG TPA: hypothetical protein VIV06_10915, partial [Candidatus Limnocylindrales bacterium]
LILLGIVFFITETFDIEVGRYGWPFFVIVPGLVIWLAAIFAGGPIGVAFSIVGAITTVTGVVLLAQDVTGYYESWAYAWALVAPGAVGLAMLVQGIIHRDREMAANGGRLTLVGLGLFLGFGLFFEGVVGLNGNPPAGLRDVVLPGGLVVLGLAIVVVGFLSGRSRAGE